MLLTQRLLTQNVSDTNHFWHKTLLPQNTSDTKRFYHKTLLTQNASDTKCFWHKTLLAQTTHDTKRFWHKTLLTKNASDTKRFWHKTLLTQNASDTKRFCWHKMLLTQKHFWRKTLSTQSACGTQPDYERGWLWVWPRFEPLIPSSWFLIRWRLSLLPLRHSQCQFYRSNSFTIRRPSPKLVCKMSIPCHGDAYSSIISTSTRLPEQPDACITRPATDLTYLREIALNPTQSDSKNDGLQSCQTPKIPKSKKQTADDNQTAAKS